MPNTQAAELDQHLPTEHKKPFMSKLMWAVVIFICIGAINSIVNPPNSSNSVSASEPKSVVKTKKGEWRLLMDPMIKHQVGVECSRSGQFLTCIATNMLAMPIHLAELHLECSKGGVIVSDQVFDTKSVPVGGKAQVKNNCDSDFDTALIKAR